MPIEPFGLSNKAFLRSFARSQIGLNMALWSCSDFRTL